MFHSSKSLYAYRAHEPKEEADFKSFLRSQDVVLMRALRDMNLPKFVFEDVPLFLGLISDLFPGLDCPRVRYPDFNDAVEQVLQEKNYIILPNQVCRRGLTSSLKSKLWMDVDFKLWISVVLGG